MKRVIIFCTNGLGELVFHSLDDENVNVIAFSDNDRTKWGKAWGGVPIVPPEKITELEYDYIIIAYASYANEIRSQLLGMGVSEEKIILFQENYDGIEWFESRIALMRKCADIITERGLKGNLAEVGVFRGDFSRLISRYLPSKKMYLFDTFEGFDQRDFQDETSYNEKSSLFKNTSDEFVVSRMPHPENCIVRKGYFPETAEGIEDEFCFVSLDTDLYNPILQGLEFFYPRMVKGGYIFVHDFGTMDWSGVKKAVYEFSDKYGAPFFPLLDRAESVVFIK